MSDEKEKEEGCDCSHCPGCDAPEKPATEADAELEPEQEEK